MRVPGVRFVQGRNRYGISTKYGIAIHATANTAAAANEAAYATRRTDGTSSHFYADAVEVIQSLDTNDTAGHAGSWQGNTYAIAVEITGTNSWSRAKWLASVNWNALGKALAAVCKAHGIPVVRVSVAQMKANAQVKGFYDHNQMRQAWGQTDHTDPGANFPWDHLLAAVKAAGGSAGDGEEDMSFEDDQVPVNYPTTDPANAKWRGPAALGHARDLAHETRDLVGELRKEVAELRKEVASRPEPGTVVVTDEQMERVLRKVRFTVDGVTPQA